MRDIFSLDKLIMLVFAIGVAWGTTRVQLSTVEAKVLEVQQKQDQIIQMAIQLGRLEEQGRNTQAQLNEIRQDVRELRSGK
jgi:hypothetical protein